MTLYDADTMTHAELVTEIKAQCKRRRLPCYDTQQISWSQDAAGWVDLVILGRGAALFVEVKKQDSRTSRRQLETHAELAAAGLWVRVWRPTDLASGLIERELDNIASEGRARAHAEQAHAAYRAPRERDGAGRYITHQEIAELEREAGFTQDVDERLSGGGTLD